MISSIRRSLSASLTRASSPSPSTSPKKLPQEQEQHQTLSESIPSIHPHPSTTSPFIYATLILQDSRGNVLETFPLLGRETVFGRSSKADVRIVTTSVSRIQCKILFNADGSQPTLQVLGSRGASLNSVYTPPSSDSCSGLYPLHESDVLSISNRHFRLSLPNRFDSRNSKPSTPEKAHPPTVQIDTPTQEAMPRKRRLRMSLVQNAVIETPAKTMKDQKKSTISGINGDQDYLIETNQDQGEARAGEAQDIVVMEQLDEDEEEAEEEPQKEMENPLQAGQGDALQGDSVPMDVDPPSFELSTLERVGAECVASSPSGSSFNPLTTSSSSSNSSPSKSKSSTPSRKERQDKKNRRSSTFYGKAGTHSISGEIKPIQPYHSTESGSTALGSPSQAKQSPTEYSSPSRLDSPKILTSHENSISNSNPQDHTSDLFNSNSKVLRLPSTFSSTQQTSPSKIPDPPRPLTHSPSKNRRISLRTDLLVKNSEALLEEKLRLKEKLQREQARLERENYQRKLKEKEELREQELEKELSSLDQKQQQTQSKETKETGDQDENLIDKRQNLERKRREELEREEEDEIDQSLSFSFSNDDLKDIQEEPQADGDAMVKSTSSPDDFSTNVKSPLSPESPAKGQLSGESARHSNVQKSNTFSTPHPKTPSEELMKTKAKKSRKSTGMIRRISIGRSKSNSLDGDWVNHWMNMNGNPKTRSVPEGLNHSGSSQSIAEEGGRDSDELDRDGETSRALDALCEEAEGHETDPEVEEEQDDSDFNDPQTTTCTSSIRTQDPTLMPPPVISTTPGPRPRSSISVRATSSLKKAGRRSSTSFYASREKKDDNSQKIGDHGGLLKEDALAALKHVLYASARGHASEDQRHPKKESEVVQVSSKEEHSIPKYGHLREMMKQVPESEELLSLGKCSKKSVVMGHPSTPDMRGLKTMLQEPKAVETPNMAGLKDLMQPHSSPMVVNQAAILSAPEMPASSPTSKRSGKSFQEQEKHQTPDLNFLKHVFTLPPSIVESNPDLKNVRDLFGAHQDELTSFTSRGQTIGTGGATEQGEIGTDLKNLMDTPAAKRVIVQAAASALDSSALEAREEALVNESLPSPVTVSNTKVQNNIQSKDATPSKNKQPRKSLGESLGVIGGKRSSSPFDSRSSSAFRPNNKGQGEGKFKEPFAASSDAERGDQESSDTSLSSSPSKDAATRKNGRKSAFKGMSSSSPSESKSTNSSSSSPCERKSKPLSSGTSSAPSFSPPSTLSRGCKNQIDAQEDRISLGEEEEGAGQATRQDEDKQEAEEDSEPQPISTRRPKRGAALAASSTIAALSSSHPPSSTSASLSKKSTRAPRKKKASSKSRVGSKKAEEMEGHEDEEADEGEEGKVISKPSSPASKARSTRGKNKSKQPSSGKERDVESELDREESQSNQIPATSPSKKGSSKGRAKSTSSTASSRKSKKGLGRKAKEEEEKEEPLIEIESNPPEKKGRKKIQKKSSARSLKAQGEEQEDQEEAVENAKSQDHEEEASATSTLGTRKLTRSKSKSSAPANSPSSVKKGTNRTRARKAKGSVEEDQEQEQDEEGEGEGEGEGEVEEIPKPKSTRGKAKAPRSQPSSDAVVIDVEAPRATRSTRSRTAK